VGAERRPTISQIVSLILICASACALLCGRRLSYAASLFTGIILTCPVLITLIFLVVKKFTSEYIFYAIVFIISLSYALYKQAEFPFPLGRHVIADMKILSDPDFTRAGISYVASVRSVKTDDEHRLAAGGKKAEYRAASFMRNKDAHAKNSRFLHGEKVLLDLPQRKKFPERGSVIRAGGFFLTLPHEKAREYALHLRSRGIHALFSGYAAEYVMVKYPQTFSPLSAANALKGYIRKVNERLYPWPHGEFCTALLTGNRDFLPRFVRESFRLSGTMHILAVSGLHIGFLVFFFFLIFRTAGLRQDVSFTFLAALIVFYLIFIGDSPSVRRATLMALCGIVIFLFDRDRNYLNVLSVVFNILWIVNPLLIINAGSVLSFTATFAILYIVPHLKRLFDRALPPVLSAPVAVSVGIQLYLAPVMLVFFGSFSYINVVANLPIVPLTGLVLALEIITLLFYPVALPIAVIVSEVNIVVVATILRTAGFFARMPPFTISGMPPFIVPLYLAGVTAVVHYVFRAGRDVPER
jgi:ComEC/Rec2-related protein